MRAASRISFVDHGNVDSLPYGKNFSGAIDRYLPFAMFGRLVVDHSFRGQKIATDMVIYRLRLLQNRAYPHPVLSLIRPEAMLQYRQFGFSEFYMFYQDNYPGLPWSNTVLAVIPDVRQVPRHFFQSKFYDLFIHFNNAV